MAAPSLSRIAVLGAGAWGTALAVTAHRAGCEVALWARSPGAAAGIAATRENARRLPGISLDPAIVVTADMEAALAGAGAVLLVVPLLAVRVTAASLAGTLRPGVPVTMCAKGIEPGSGLFPAEIVAALLPESPVVVLSGPTFAAEVAAGKPTAVTLACREEAIAASLAAALGSESFRPYSTNDVAGVETGGALKNVLAIACGIVAGRRLGENARAALIARGLAEMTRLAVALGGRMETVSGLSGLGDVALSCTSPTSRNYALGLALGEGVPLAEAAARSRGVTEGVATSAAVVTRAQAAGVELPVAEAVASILASALPIDDAIARLLARPLRREG